MRKDAIESGVHASAIVAGGFPGFSREKVQKSQKLDYLTRRRRAYGGQVGGQARISRIGTDSGTADVRQKDWGQKNVRTFQ
jgi:hypothetical protein